MKIIGKIVDNFLKLRINKIYSLKINIVFTRESWKYPFSDKKGMN